VIFCCALVISNKSDIYCVLWMLLLALWKKFRKWGHLWEYLLVVKKLIIFKQFQHCTVRNNASELVQKATCSHWNCLVDEFRVIECQNAYFLTLNTLTWFGLNFLIFFQSFLHFLYFYWKYFIRSRLLIFFDLIILFKRYLWIKIVCFLILDKNWTVYYNFLFFYIRFSINFIFF